MTPSSDIGYVETTMSKAQFVAQVQQVSSCARSLASCLPAEVADEKIALAHQINLLMHAKPQRKNPHLSAMRRSAVDYAHEVMNRRFYGGDND